jgi:hypothetical protein
MPATAAFAAELDARVPASLASACPVTRQHQAASLLTWSTQQISELLNELPADFPRLSE